MDSKYSINESHLLILGLFFVVIVFIIDLLLPLGIAVGILYLAPLLIVSFSRKLSHLYLCATMCSFLCVVSAFLSPSIDTIWKPILNRFISISVLWIVTMLIQQLSKTLARTMTLNKELNERKEFLEQTRKILLSVCEDANLAKEEALRTKNQAEQIIESAPSAMIMVNETGRIVLVNKLTEVTFGYSREEILNQPIEMLIPQQYQTRHPQYRENYFNDPLRREMGKGRDLFGLRKDGSEVPIEIGLNPMQTKEGVFILASVVDITERKKVEKEIKHYQQVLEKYSYGLEDDVKEKTAQLSNAQSKLLRSEKMAALGKLSSLVGHELRGPLGVIKNSSTFIGMRLSRVSDEKVQKHLRIIDEEITHSDAIISTILGFARTKEPEYSSVDVCELLENILKSQKEAPSIAIQFQKESNFPLIQADKNLLERVFTNIIDNAVQAMPSGGSLTITTDFDEKYATVSFQDTGYGIPKDHLCRIFEPLYSTKSKGTGLGLSACENIIKAHHGSLTVESEEGKGSKFIAQIPIDPKMRSDNEN